jgi:cytoskeletal protein RodZ
MAKTNEEFDKGFREKLGNHQEKPSALAWERLENQLPKPKSSLRGIWWAVAASVTVILAAGWMFWNTTDELPQEQLLAEETLFVEENSENPSPEPLENLNSQEEAVSETLPEKPVTSSFPKQTSTQSSNRAFSTQSIQTPVSTDNLIALTEPIKIEPTAVIPVESLEATEIALPAIQTNSAQLAVAEATSPQEEAPLFRVSIYSDGLKKGAEPDKNLITEMGKTVGKVEGLLGKVDEGFAEIQDKKNGLFASLTSRK